VSQPIAPADSVARVRDASSEAVPSSVVEGAGLGTETEILDAIDLLADGYYEMDRAYRYRRVNPAGLQIAQKTPGQILGKHVLDVFPDVARAAIHQTTVRVMETGRAERVETYYPPHHR
jgi:PAS domain-containing protein